MRSYFINNEEVSASGFYYNDQLNTRTNCSCTITHLRAVPELNVGDTLKIMNGAEVVFVGLLKNINKFERYPGELQYNITASDNTALADKRLAFKVYNQMLLGDIVKDVLAVFLDGEGITEGNIQDGPIIEKAVFNYIPVSQAFDYLKNISGMNWEIDFDRKLHFFTRDSNAAPFILNDTVKHYNFSEVKNLDQYRNVQFTRGGRGETSLQNLERPAPKPDGQTQTFTLRFPLASKPIIFIDTVEVPQIEIGINGKDVDKQWYYTINGNTITQDSDLAPLDTETLEVTYRGYRNLFGRVDDPTQIDARKAVEDNTSGIYERVTDEKSINNIPQLLQYGQGLIEKYCDINNQITFTTNEKGLASGQLLRVTKDIYGINEDFLIDNVKASPNGELIEYQVTALDGASFGGWEDFFKDLYNQSKSFIIAENELLIILNNTIGTRVRSGLTNIKTYIAPFVSDDLIIPFTIGGDIKSEVNLLD
jgi:hypothetical protein